MCHLSIEKMLKAVTAEILQKMSPKTHNLIYLIKISGIQLPRIKMYPENTTKNYLIKTREVVEWLKKHETLK